jgi:uncharacterized membrane protein YadS
MADARGADRVLIKIGLVILGASLLFMEVPAGGALGILQPVLVVFVVWYSVLLAVAQTCASTTNSPRCSPTAVSICGVSAAIAACGAIQGDKKKLSYVTSLVLIVAVPMMIAMPWIAKSPQWTISSPALARRHARHRALGGRGRRADQRRRHEDRRDREILAERA